MNEPADWGAPGVPGAPPCDGDQSIFESELSSPPLLELSYTTSRAPA